jgi:hypothetical protein
MATRALLVSVEPVDYTYGGWCRECALPSGVRVVVMVGIGPSFHLRTFDRCGDCGGDQIDPPEGPS